MLVMVFLCYGQVNAQESTSSAADPEPETGPAPSFRKDAIPERLGYIDTYLEEAWSAEKVKPSPNCTDSEFLRRAYLDLLGRIPSIRESQAFFASKDSSKRAKLINVLLAHPDYAKHMGTLYANLLIGRRPQDRQVDHEALAGWLRQQFAADRPWNEVVFDLVDAKGSNKENGAANFVLAHFADEKVNLTSVTTRVFLGQQIQCTQCHDHKYNDWKQQDFWGINAFFRGTRSRPIERVDKSGAIVRDAMEVYDDPTDEWARFERPAR